MLIVVVVSQAGKKTKQHSSAPLDKFASNYVRWGNFSTIRDFQKQLQSIQDFCEDSYVNFYIGFFEVEETGEHIKAWN